MKSKNTTYNKLIEMKDQYESNVELLNFIFGSNWSFVIDSFIDNDIRKVMNIRVTIPGMIRSGIGSGLTYNDALEGALSFMIDTCGSTIVKTEIIESVSHAIVANVTKSLDELGNAINNIKDEELVKIEIPEKVEQVVIDIPKEDNVVDVKIEGQKDVAPKVRKIMDKYSIDQDTAMKYAIVCNKYKITTKEILLKYLQAWNNDIKDTEELVSTNVSDFINWGYKNEEGFKI